MSLWTGRAILRSASKSHTAHQGSNSRRNPRKNDIVQEYVLPNFSSTPYARTGYIRSGPNALSPSELEEAEPAEKMDSAPKSRRKAPGDDDEEQVLFMGNERFAGPELLFHPDHIGEFSRTAR